MSDSTPDPDAAPMVEAAPEQTAADAPAAPHERPNDGWSLIALVPYDGVEPPATASEDLAQAVWCAVTAPWHPSLLARARELPRFEAIESPTPPGPREIRIIAGDQGSRLPSGYRTQVE